MVIYLKKFGNILTSRQLGKEAYAAFKPTLENVATEDVIEVSFEGVSTFSPSWGDEFLSPLVEKFGDRVVLTQIQKNPSVIITLQLLKDLENKHFKVLS